MLTLTKEKNKVKATKFTVIELDQTHYWADEIQAACGKIMTVFIYDAGQHTYCCEITPSYFLTPLYSYPIYPDHIDLDKMGEEEYYKYVEHWEDEIRQGDAQTSEGSYYHVHTIEGVDEKYKKRMTECDGKYYASEGKKYKELEKEANDFAYESRPFS